MFSRQKQAFFVLILIFAVLGIFSTLTNSLGTIASANTFFLALACIFFVFSIAAWVFSWALLLKKRSKLPFWGVVLAGFSSVYGSLTPLQIGSDALRALLLKDWFKASYADSLASSMITKGLKFLLIAILASVTALFFFFSEASVFFKAAFFSGFVVIAIAAALFLLPVNKKIGLKIADFFRRLSKLWKKFLLFEKFFLAYSDYLNATSKKIILVVFAIVAFSLFLEFLALFFSFFAVSIEMAFELMAVLFIIAVVLDRAPFLPRGIGLVESIGFFFVSINAPNIAQEKIAAAFVIFAIARLVVPTILSLAVYFACAKQLPKKIEQKTIGKKPESAVQKNNNPNN